MAKGSKMGYAKNAGKSLASAGIDAVGDLMPNLRNGIKSNKSLALNTYKKYKEDSTPFDIQKTYLYKSTKRLIDNAINDTKSGNFNNKKREAENDSFAAMFDLDFDFDNSLNDSDSLSMGDSTGNSFDVSNFSVNADLDEETKFDIKVTANISKASLKMTNIGFATLTSQLKILNQFHNENTVKFYDSMEEKVANIENNMSLVGAYLTDLSQNSTRSANSTNRKARKSDAFQMQGIAIQDWIDLYSKGKSKQSGGMSSMFEFFIKPEIEKLVANPMGWLSKTAIKTAIPKKYKNSMKDMDNLAGMLPMLAQGKFKDWSKNGNFLQKTLGNLLNLDKFKTKANKYKYEKGVIGFDGITKRAITHVIPGYLSRILTAVTQNSGDKNLTYDFDSGKFVNSKEAKKNYKASLENEIRGALSNDSNDAVKDLKTSILNSAKKNGKATTDSELADLNDRLDKMMVTMAKKGMTFGNAREAKDLGLDEDTANMVMESYKGLKGKKQANLENVLASAWVDYERKLDSLTEDSLFQSVYDRKSFSKKDSEYKKSKVNVSAKVSDTVDSVNNLVNGSNLSEGKKNLIKSAMDKINGINKDNSRSEKIDSGIDKLYKFFTSGENYGKSDSSDKDGSGEVSKIATNIEEISNIAMANMAIQANQSGDKSAIKFGKSMFGGIKTGRANAVRTKIYSKMTAANGKPTMDPVNNAIQEQNEKIKEFNEDMNNLRKEKNVPEKTEKPIEVIIMGGNVETVEYIEDIKEMADPKDPNSANEQRAKMKEETKIREELMKKNSEDGHENVAVKSIKELLNPEGAGGAGKGGGIFKEIIGETVGSMASSMLLSGGGITAGIGKLFGKGAGLLGGAGKVAGMGGKAITGIGKGALGLLGGAGKVAGMGGKAIVGMGKGAAGLLGGAGKAAGLLGGAAKFLGPIGLGITALQGIGGGMKGFKNAGETFGKLPGEKVTLGEKLSGGLGGVLSSLSLGLLNGEKMSKGIHGIGSGIGKVGKTMLKYSPIGLMGNMFGKLFGKKDKNDDNEDTKKPSLAKALLKLSPIGLAGTMLGKLFGLKDKKDKDKIDPESSDGKMVEGMEKLNKVINGGPFTDIFGSRGLFMGMHKAAKSTSGGITGFFKGLFGGGGSSSGGGSNGDYTNSEGGSASNGDGTGTGGGDVTLEGSYSTDWLTDTNSIINKSLKIPTEMTAETLSAAIESMHPGSPLAGKAQIFLNAAKKHNIDPLYLVSHAAVETGWGKSQICRDKHNYFGWNAVDSDPYNQATGFANAEDGIMRGAGYIAKNYVYGEHGQDTLYKMRHNSGVHQYATDPNWHTTIASVMSSLGRANGGKGVWGGNAGVNKGSASGKAAPAPSGGSASGTGGVSTASLDQPTAKLPSIPSEGLSRKLPPAIANMSSNYCPPEQSGVNPANLTLMSTVNKLMGTVRGIGNTDYGASTLSPFSKYITEGKISPAMKNLKNLISGNSSNNKAKAPTSAFNIGPQGAGPSTGERFRNRTAMKADIKNSERNYRDNNNNSLMLKIKDVLEDIYENGQTTNELLTTLLGAIEKNTKTENNYEPAVFSSQFEMNTELKLLFTGN